MRCEWTTPEDAEVRCTREGTEVEARDCSGDIRGFQGLVTSFHYYCPKHAPQGTTPATEINKER